VNSEVRELEPQRISPKLARTREAISRQSSISAWATGVREEDRWHRKSGIRDVKDVSSALFKLAKPEFPIREGPCSRGPRGHM
jgi:hypothetical protein